MKHIGLFEGTKIRHCVFCGGEYEATRAWQKYCHRNCQSKQLRKQHGIPISIKGKYCKQCGKHFKPDSAGKMHCSTECSVKSARQSRSKFFKKNPDIQKEYYKKTINKIGHRGNLDRFYLRHPNASKSCESCGEDRVLDIAHKPEYKRNGEWRKVSNTSIEKVWILCPTCHALIDRKGYEPATLGLK